MVVPHRRCKSTGSSAATGSVLVRKLSANPSCPKMRTEPKARILEAFSRFAQTSRRGTGSAIGAPEQTRPVQKHKRTQDWRAGCFDRHRPVASHRSGACRRRCRRFGFSARAGKTPSSNGMPRSRAETWIQARAAPGPERASRLRRGSPASILVSRVAFFPPPDGPVSGRHPIWRKRGTRKSGLETNAENEARSTLLARLW